MHRIPRPCFCSFYPPLPAQAAALDGAAMSWPWALPFAGILLSIATGPLLFPKIWHHHYGKIAAGWAAARACAARARVSASRRAFAAFVHAMLGGISELHRAAVRALHGRGRHPGHRQSARHARDQYRHAGVRHSDRQHRRHHRRRDDPDPAAAARERGRARSNAHVVVFFIILVANVGGALTPARRSAAVRRLPARRRFLLDRAASVAADRDRRRSACWRCSSRSISGLSRRDERCRSRDETPAADPHPRQHQFRPDRAASSRRS